MTSARRGHPRRGAGRRERVGRLGGSDRGHGELRGGGHPEQGDRDRDEPPTREHRRQPLQDARRRRHPRPAPHRQRDRDDRLARPRPGRARGHARSRPHARRGRSSPRIPAGAGPARVGEARPCSSEAGRASDTRDVSRSHTLLDHTRRDGVEGFLTITGGKATTFRLMAEVTVDAVCENSASSGRAGPRGAPGSERDLLPGGRAPRRARRPSPRSSRSSASASWSPAPRSRRRWSGGTPHVDLDDIRRTLRLGMGPCQGGVLHLPRDGHPARRQGLDARSANRSLL